VLKRGLLVFTFSQFNFISWKKYLSSRDYYKDNNERAATDQQPKRQFQIKSLTKSFFTSYLILEEPLLLGCLRNSVYSVCYTEWAKIPRNNAEFRVVKFALIPQNSVYVTLTFSKYCTYEKVRFLILSNVPTILIGIRLNN
jgi:hypothetical protein